MARLDIGRVGGWERYPWLVHGYSSRTGGVSAAYGGRALNLGWTKEDTPEAVRENRRLLMSALGEWTDERLATVRQVHGTAIHTIDEIHKIEGKREEMPSAEGHALLEGDGLMTAVPGVLLGIQTADCVPVTIVDVGRRVVAVLHAGWRGTAAGMAMEGVARMREEFGSRPEDMAAAVGPSIGPCCYAVGEEAETAFLRGFLYGEKLFQGGTLDLWEANRRQLMDAGVAADRIAVMGQCTACARTGEGERRYFSHRAEGGVTGRMMTVVGVRDSR